MGSVTYARVWTPFLKDFENRCLLPTLVTSSQPPSSSIIPACKPLPQMLDCWKNSNINERDPELTTIHPKLDIAFKYVNRKKSTCKSVRCHIEINKMQSECIYLPCHNDLIQLLFHSCTSSLVGIRTWLKIYQIIHSGMTKSNLFVADVRISTTHFTCYK